MGLSFDAWGFSQQLPDIAFLARAAPDATIILNHVGTPMIIAGDDPADVKAAWRKGIREAAACPNVVVKLGGLMMLAGPGDTEMSSERAAETMRNYMLETIDAFGPNRCMFESNFPVCALRISYGNLWNAYKRLATGYTRTEREAMFAGVAARAYRLAI
jgi:predicted TIM-barrel fold metal-dependent hydrolase